jgi:hypothetical protein
MRATKTVILTLAVLTVTAVALAEEQKFHGTLDANSSATQVISVQSGRTYEVKFKAHEEHGSYQVTVVRRTHVPRRGGGDLIRPTTVAEQQADDGKANLRFTGGASKLGLIDWAVVMQNNSNKPSKYELKVEEQEKRH